MSEYIDGKKKFTVLDFQKAKHAGAPLVMLTAYDFPSATALERAGIDCILVGDSLGMVALGYPNTLPVSMDEMIHHCKAVARGASRPLLIGDMPFLSYQVSPAEAVANAGRFLKEAGMDAVKLEGGREMLPAIQAILDAGIPVLGHLGLTPQSVHKFGGMRVQGKSAEQAELLLEDAQLLEQTGCFGIVLECIPAKVATLITAEIRVPTIGIGAGRGCDGQVLVTNDLLGIYDQKHPRFVRRYAALMDEMVKGAQAFAAEVQSREFPAPEHEFEMADDEWVKFSGKRMTQK